jgi:hypothetical protein
VPACVHCAGTAPCARRSSSSTPSGRTPWLESAHPEDAGLRLVPGSAAAPYNWQSESEVALLVPRCSSSASCLPAAHGGAAMCGAAGSPRTGLRRVGRGGQDPSELASRCAAATGLSCRASRCMSGSASVPAAQLPTAASRCATLQALHTPVHQMWGGAARTPARASTVVDNTCPQKGNQWAAAYGGPPQHFTEAWQDELWKKLSM